MVFDFAPSRNKCGHTDLNEAALVGDFPLPEGEGDEILSNEKGSYAKVPP
jgi:hypothetical protein